MYKKIYYADFKDLDNNNIKLEIYKNTDNNVTASELILDSDAISIDYQGDDDVFYPLKCSGCKVSILTKTLLTDLYSGKANEIYCKVFRNGSLFWFGYITPNIYNSDYVDEYNKLELEFIDVISNLDNYNYTYINGAQAISSFYEIIMHILGKLDTDQVITRVYLHKTKKLNSSFDLLNNMFINERNFFDEDDEAEKCKDVLEYIASYLGMTLLQFEDKLYLLDYEAFKSNNTAFLTYNRTNTNTGNVTISQPTLNINSNVFEANGSISLNDIYNKIVVIGNNNPIDDVIPELFDEDDLINQNENPNKYWETQETIDNVNYTLLTAYFKSQNNWKYMKAKNGILSEMEIGDEITSDNVNNINQGVWWQKVDSYKNSDGEPSSLSWKEYLTFFARTSFSWTPYDEVYLELNNDNLMLFKGGYFIMNLTYKMSKYPTAHEPKKTGDDKYFKNKYNTGFTDTWIPCRLAIGDHYYDGEQFLPYTNYYNKVSRGYYKNVSGAAHYSGQKWFCYVDSYGYRRFVTQSEYNALPSSTEKYSDYCITNDMHYFTNDAGDKVFTTTEYYYECLLQDRFFLVHINKEDDKIFDEEKKLTNTVSYKMNLVDSEDGVAIPIPSDLILHGKMTFQLYKPNHLCDQPCWATSDGSDWCYGFHFSDLVFKYTTDKYAVDLFSGKRYELDQKYENEIDTDNVTEFDDIELRINTYNAHAGSYSYVISKNSDDYDYVNQITNTNTDESAISEEHIINKYSSYYSVPKFIYSNTLRGATQITPFTKYHENTLNKNFIGNSLTYNLATNSIDISSNEE